MIRENNIHYNIPTIVVAIDRVKSLRHSSRSVCSFLTITVIYYNRLSQTFNVHTRGRVTCVEA